MTQYVVKHIFFALLVFSQGAQVLACECRWNGPFSWVAQDSATVMLGRVVASQGNSFDIEVLEQLKGRDVLRTVRIWGDRGDQCRPPVDYFPVGSEWLFALDKINELPAGGFNPSTPNISFGRVGDYALSKCGAYWLAHDDGLLAGNITSLFEWDYAPEMNPVPLGLMARFLSGEADYVDIIGVSDEVTSPEAWMRKMKERFQRHRGD